jgi:signal transduction histidine kinase
MVYVAQTSEERLEAAQEIASAVLLAGRADDAARVLWLSSRVRRELRPLQDLSHALGHYDPLLPGASLGVAAREELQPVHAAIDALAGRLAKRIADERAFTSHAAHALRTPLAGIDAQLAVALREADAPTPAAPAAACAPRPSGCSASSSRCWRCSAAAPRCSGSEIDRRRAARRGCRSRGSSSMRGARRR